MHVCRCGVSAQFSAQNCIMKGTAKCIYIRQKFVGELLHFSQNLSFSTVFFYSRILKYIHDYSKNVVLDFVKIAHEGYLGRAT
jgi:hypothetical protein